MTINWYEQTMSMMQMWSEAQQQMMRNWTSAAKSAQQTVPRWTERMMPADMLSTSMRGIQEAVNMWRNMTLQSIRSWTSSSDNTVQSIAENMFASQSALMRLFEQSIKVWQNLIPVLEAGDDWESVLNKQMENIRATLIENSAQGMGKSADMNKMWLSYLEQWQTFGAPWWGALQKITPDMSNVMGGLMNGDPEAFRETTDIFWDAYQETFGKLLRAPSVGLTREMDEKVRNGFAAWVDMQQALFEYQVIVVDMWVNSFDQFVRDMVKMAEEGQTIDSIRGFLDKWSITADQVFKESYRSEAYIRMQGKMIDTLMAFRKSQGEVTEMVMQSMDLPTRSEIDEAHRRIYELRKEVKALRREMDALKGHNEPAEKENKAPARRPATRKKTEAAETHDEPAE